MALVNLYLSVFLLGTPLVVYARGRYEFIDDADLPAFYSMRSAQLAQQAQQLQQSGQSLYYPYQYYQQSVADETRTQSPPISIPVAPLTSPVTYNPYLHYSPANYRPQTSFVASARSTIYNPYAAYLNTAQFSSKSKKKAAR